MIARNKLLSISNMLPRAWLLKALHTMQDLRLWGMHMRSMSSSSPWKFLETASAGCAPKPGALAALPAHAQGLSFAGMMSLASA